MPFNTVDKYILYLPMEATDSFETLLHLYQCSATYQKNNHSIQYHQNLNLIIYSTVQ
jgi:hypothetical protein